MSHQDNSINEPKSFCLRQEIGIYHNKVKSTLCSYTFLFKILHPLQLSLLHKFVEGHLVNIHAKIVFNFEPWFKSGCLKFLNLAAMFLINRFYFPRSHIISAKYFEFRRLLMFTKGQAIWELSFFEDPFRFNYFCRGSPFC